jgi:hypothetical protein
MPWVEDTSRHRGPSQPVRKDCVGVQEQNTRDSAEWWLTVVGHESLSSLVAEIHPTRAIRPPPSVIFPSPLFTASLRYGGTTSIHRRLTAGRVAKGGLDSSLLLLEGGDNVIASPCCVLYSWISTPTCKSRHMHVQRTRSAAK